MKQIKILLSSVLTLLLFTGNNAYAAPHYSDFNGRPGFKANKPNMNVFKGQVRKGNINAFKGQARKGNRFVPDGRNDGKVTLKRKALPNRNSGGRLYNNGAFREGGSSGATRRRGDVVVGPGSVGFVAWPAADGLEHGPGIVSTGGAHAVNDNDSRISVLDIEGTGEGVIKSTGAFDIAPVEKDGFTASSEEQHISGKDGVLGGQESGWFHPVDGSITNTTTTPTIIDHWVVTPKPDGALGPDVVTTLDQKTNQVWTNGNATSKRNGVSVLTGNGEGTFNLVPPGIVSTGGVHAVADSSTGADLSPSVNDNDSRIVGATGANGVQQPKGVQLKFIEGEWR